MGVDLGSWWSQGRFRALLEMIDRRPAASLLSEAIYTDPDNAEFLLEERQRLKKKSRRWAPRISDFDIHAEMLMAIANDVRSALGAKQWDLFPSPETAADVLERIKREKDAADIIAIATPKYADLMRDSMPGLR